MPITDYVEVRNGGYYLGGTRIGLDVLVHDFRRGRSPEAIFDAYPSIGSLAKPGTGRGLRRKGPSVDFRPATGVIPDGTADLQLIYGYGK